MEPKYGEWEDLPVRWLPGEAWAFIDGAWKRVDSSDVGNNGAELDKSSFEAAFGRLIALPAIAFQDNRLAVDVLLLLARMPRRGSSRGKDRHFT